MRSAPLAYVSRKRPTRRASVVVAAVFLATTVVCGSVLGLCSLASLKELVEQADLIFVGTATRIESLSILHTMVTRYRFDRVKYIKGSGPVDSLILIQEGGTDGRFEIAVEHEASFSDSCRYVVFAGRGHHKLPPHFRAQSCSVTELVWSPRNGVPDSLFDVGRLLGHPRGTPPTNRPRMSESQFLLSYRSLLQSVSADSGSISGR